MSSAYQVDRPLVLLRCSTDVQAAETLCQELLQALAEAAGPRIIRRIAAGTAVPKQPGDLSVILHVDTAQGSGLTGRLEWQLGPDGPTRTGPSLRLDSMDRPLSSTLYAAFSRELVRADANLTAALAAHHPD